MYIYVAARLNRYVGMVWEWYGVVWGWYGAGMGIPWVVWEWYGDGMGMV